MKVKSKDFRVPEGEKIKLKNWPTKVRPCFQSKEDYQGILGEHAHELSDLQHLMFAQNRYALLLIFQGMDAAGKDGAIGHVMSGVNPQGCQVYSFKNPSTLELGHDFLWRTTCRLPERGRMGIGKTPEPTVGYYQGFLAVNRSGKSVSHDGGENQFFPQRVWLGIVFRGPERC